MDIKLEKKPWYIRYRSYLMAGGAFIIFLIYVISLSLGPKKLRIETDNIQLAEVRNGKFMEYVDVEGLVQPILTIKVNTREAGSVDRIVAEEGTLMKKGDTILVLNNPDLIREIEDQRDEWENQRYTYQEREIEMEQKSLTLKQQALQTQYEMNRLQKSFGLEKEEYKMGIKSKAQLEVSEAEYNYNLQKSALQMESLRHDSAMTIIRKDLLRNERERGQKKFLRSMDRLEGLVMILRDRHTKRLKNGACSVDTGLVFIEALTYLERASDQCSSIAVMMMARNNEAILHNHYDYLREIHAGNDAAYLAETNRRREQYIKPLKEIT